LGHCNLHISGHEKTKSTGPNILTGVFEGQDCWKYDYL